MSSNAFHTPIAAHRIPELNFQMTTWIFNSFSINVSHLTAHFLTRRCTARHLTAVSSVRSEQRFSLAADAATPGFCELACMPFPSDLFCRQQENRQPLFHLKTSETFWYYTLEFFRRVWKLYPIFFIARYEQGFLQLSIILMTTMTMVTLVFKKTTEVTNHKGITFSSSKFIEYINLPISCCVWKKGMSSRQNYPVVSQLTAGKGKFFLVVYLASRCCLCDICWQHGRK